MEFKADEKGAVITLRIKGNNHTFGISELAHQQIASRLQIPYRYYQKMQEQQPALLQENVNTWLHDAPERRMIRTLDGSMRAFLSDRYRRLDNLELCAAVLPIINLSGAWFSTKLYEGPFKLNETAAAAFCFALTLIPLTGILFVGHYHIVLCVIFFALFTTLITAINHLVITLIPVRFAKYGCASTVGGIFNSCTYIGSAISTYGFGAVSEKFGWTATVIFWIILGAIGVAVCAVPMRRYGRFANGSGNKA